ncbi:hypothetical protein MO767_30265, partial [Pseudomonas sp. UYIF39]|nr:hypothetical protein [Pseudomonas sp. UYIF39]
FSVGRTASTGSVFGQRQQVLEVKEKFGGLRIYYRGGDDYVCGVFNLAEVMSVNICAICGSRVGNRRMHYHHPRCDLHYES